MAPRSLEHATVLIVARPGDDHGDQVESTIRSRGESVERLSLNTFRDVSIDWEPAGPLHIQTSTGDFLVGSTSTIWWRRPGWPEVGDLDSEEADFIQSEIHVILEGTLLACAARWVDDPLVVQKAENKLFQLAAIRRCSILVPNSIVTNSVSRATKFASGRSILAKTVSVGEGIAPFADEVPTDLLEKVRAAPVLLQERIEAVADLRIVTVGKRAFTWSRRRKQDDPVDWRRHDPEGSDFQLTSQRGAEDQALRVARALGLTHSAQDWLQTSDDFVFLEANPGGQWLFLPGASDTIVPVLVDHLLGDAS
jgi:hypothetical protein